jgi:RNA polymerase sigma-70 factor (ECF subfamily)
MVAKYVESRLKGCVDAMMAAMMERKQTETGKNNERQLRDETIIRRVLDGDRESFAELVEQYQRLVCHIANDYLRNPDEVDDAAQEVFFRSYRALDRYNPEYRFSTWLSGITRNYCLDVIRKKGHVTIVDFESCEYLATDGHTPEEIWLEEEERAELKTAVDALPESYKEVVRLYHNEELSYQAMSERMEKPLSIVKNRLMRARRMLEKNLVASGQHA